jgi:hypothetical protein
MLHHQINIPISKKYLKITQSKCIVRFFGKSVIGYIVDYP